LRAVTAFVAQNAETLLASGVGVALFSSMHALGSTHAKLTAALATERELRKMDVTLARELHEKERKLRYEDVSKERELREKDVATERALRALEKAAFEAQLQAERELRANAVAMLSSRDKPRSGWWPR
jgi:hypothetical protein